MSKGLVNQCQFFLFLPAEAKRQDHERQGGTEEALENFGQMNGGSLVQNLL